MRLRNRFDRTRLRGDIYGGVTAAIVALPLAVAFGVTSGAGPVAGLYGAVCVGLFAALFGGTPSQISGPTGPMTIVAASVFAFYVETPAVAFTVFMLGGVFQIMFGALKLGRYINLMPYPVISGFMSGIGCILIIMQVDQLLGHPSPSDTISALRVLPAYLREPNADAIAAGLLTLAICVLTPRRVARIVPSHLLALVAGTVSVLVVLDAAPVLGPIPSGLPALQVPTFDTATLQHMLISALVLGLLGSIDSLLTSLVADNATRTFHDSDQELVGQGIGNIAAGLLGGIPGAGATVRTLTNIRAGGRTALSGIVHALVLLGIVLGLGWLAAYIPYAVLAGILIKVGFDVIDWSYLRRIFHAPKGGVMLMAVVLLLTVFVDVITAVATGMVIASLLFVKEMADLQLASIRTVVEPADHELLTIEEATEFAACKGRAMLVHLAGPMSFGAANGMTRRLAGATAHDVLILDLLDVPMMDSSAALAIESIVQRAQQRGQAVILVGLGTAVARMFAKLGILRLIKDTERLRTRRDALREAARVIRERTAHAAT
ncbi:MAG TPA: SulP family inorganic anion transporter [Gammaproteobacteria bacterium]|nr:SulP family inorganic anion transporter [Gammaproteobacteria bacterium]